MEETADPPDHRRTLFAEQSLARSLTPLITSVRRPLRLALLTGAVAIAVTALLLLAAEGTLRLLHYGHPAAFTVPCTVRGRPAYCDNDRFTWQFFPPGAFRLPAAFAIPAEKRPGTFRVFVVGESAAQGDPEPSYSFSRYLDVMLRARFPDVSFEIINTGIAALNSHALLPVTRDLARHEGDLFVLYLGNNEVVGPYGSGTTLTRREVSLPLIRAGILLNSTRLGQLIGSGVRALTDVGDQRTWGGMTMFLEQQVAADAPAMASVYRNFRSNLRDIVEAAGSSGARVLVSTVAVNLKHSAPFASLHRDGLGAEERAEWEARVSEGDSLEHAGRHDAALERYLQAAAIDDRHAELQFRIGRACWELERFVQAKERFAKARDLDALRFRADREVNAIVRAVAADAGPGVEVLDAESLFAGSSPHGVPGRELFYEHVHLRPQGSYLLARALFPRVVALLPEAIRRAGATEPPSRLEAERLLALTGYDRRRVARSVIEWLRQPPFTGQLTWGEEIGILQREAEKEADDPVETAAAYRRAIAQAPDDHWLQFNYGRFLEAYGELAAAEVVYRRALELLPGNYAASDKLASVLARTGKYDEAIAASRELLRRMPYHPTAHMTMGYALARTGAYDQSIAAYERATALHAPYALEAFTSIGVIRLQQERYDAAAAAFRAALERDTAGARRADLMHRLRIAEARGRELDGRTRPPSSP